jgi:hypothetical protein
MTISVLEAPTSHQSQLLPAYYKSLYEGAQTNDQQAMLYGIVLGLRYGNPLLFSEIFPLVREFEDKYIEYMSRFGNQHR